MANRRMFSKQIIDSDQFLDMPMTAQCLYFHLCMRADDDGFVDSPNRIMRLIGANLDDMKLLMAKAFVITFDRGIIVIKHWRLHNLIRSDRYTPTLYQEELKALNLDENNIYELASTGEKLIKKVEFSQQNVTHSGNQMEPQDSIGKDSIGKDTNICSPNTANVKEEFEFLWTLYPRKQGKQKALSIYQSERKRNPELFAEVKAGIEAYKDYIKSNRISMQYVKLGQTWFSGRCWQDDYSQRHERKESRVLNDIPDYTKQTPYQSSVEVDQEVLEEFFGKN